MWLAYGHREDLAGISLQKQTVSVNRAENFNVDFVGMVDTPVFLYELSGIGGAIGVSPQPHHWSQFTTKHGRHMKTCPPGFACSDPNIWEPWWFYYTSQARLFTLYLAHPLTIVTQHREKGVHEKGIETKRDFDYIKEWHPCWDKHNLPTEIPRFNLNLGLVSDAVQEAIKINDRHGMVIVTILGDDDISNNEPPYQRLPCHEKDILLDKTLFIVQTPLLRPHDLHLPHLALDTGRPASNLTAEHLLHILTAITQQEIKVLTLPASWAGSPAEIQNMGGPTLMAGRRKGQTSPTLEFMFFDGGIEKVFRFIERWRHILAKTGKFHDFRQTWLNDLGSGHNMQWDWLAQ